MKNDTLPRKRCSIPECLLAFKQRGGDLEALAKFTKAPLNTVKRWNKDRLPLAEVLLRLQHYFLMNDYAVAGFETMNPWIFKLGQCIVFDVVSCDSITTELGLEDPHSLFRYFQGKSGVSTARLLLIEDICKKHETTLQQKIEERRSEFPAVSTSVPADGLVADFAKACEQVRVLGAQLLSGPIENRDNMRETMGQGSEPPLHLTWEVLNKLLREPFAGLNSKH